MVPPSTTAGPCRPAGTSSKTPNATQIPEEGAAAPTQIASIAQRGALRASVAPDTSGVSVQDATLHSSVASVADVQLHEGPGEDTRDDSSYLHAFEVQQTLLEASQKLSKLLGMEGEEMRRRADALEAVVDVHRSDSQMYHEIVSLVSMPSWLLTEVISPCTATHCHTVQYRNRSLLCCISWCK